MSETLPPCKATGKPCRWESEHWHNDAGEMTSWDDFCRDCGQWRDWSKDVCPEPPETVAAGTQAGHKAR